MRINILWPNFLVFLHLIPTIFGSQTCGRVASGTQLLNWAPQAMDILEKKARQTPTLQGWSTVHVHLHKDMIMHDHDIQLLYFRYMDIRTYVMHIHVIKNIPTLIYICSHVHIIEYLFLKYTEIPFHNRTHPRLHILWRQCAGPGQLVASATQGGYHQLSVLALGSLGSSPRFPPLGWVLW